MSNGKLLTEDQMVKLLEAAKLSGDMRPTGNICAANILVDTLRKRMLECPRFAGQEIQEMLRSDYGVYLVATLLAEALPLIPGQEDDNRVDALCKELRFVGEEYRGYALLRLMLLGETSRGV